MSASTRDPVHAVGNATPIQPVTEHQLRRARIVTACNVPQPELRVLLQMLGIANPPEVKLERQDAAA